MLLRESSDELLVAGVQDRTVDSKTNFYNGENSNAFSGARARTEDPQVVEETSAVLSGFISIVLDSDHLKLNKFSSARDGNYVSVSFNLCRIAAEAPEMIQRHQKSKSE